MLNIQAIPISKIARAKYNPRKTLKPGDPAYDRLKKAVTAFGMVEPLVWNSRSGNLVGGHQRLSILEERGDATVEVSVVDLDERSEKALNLALNKHSGEWEFASLADLLQELDAGDLDMELTGFSAAELEKMMTWTAPNAGLTDENAVPEPPKEPIAKLGDLWLLGKHRLICGDSTNATDVARLFDGVEPGLMVTDPPYGVKYDPAWRDHYGPSASFAGDGKLGKRARGKVEADDRADWAETYALFPENIAYVWHGGLHAMTVAQNLIDCDFALRAQIVWRKQHFVFSRGDYHWQHEPCWHAVKNKGNWAGDRKQTTVWDIENLNPMGGNKKEKQTGHGTQKPVECMRRPIVNHTNPGQAVYDPFMGSGTTIIAAESTGRIAYGIEIDPVYVDVAVKRWEDFAGKKATLAQ